MTHSLAWLKAFDRKQIWQLVRFYQAALVNTAFGFGVYALLIWLGLNLYLAQICAQIVGMTFNYLTYSRHVFRDSAGDKRSFVAAYVLNYLVNLVFLFLFDHVVRSDYAAGLGATLCASLLNYFVLKHLVFRAKHA